MRDSMVAAVELACSMKAHRKPLTARRNTGSGVVTNTAPRVPPSTIMAAVPWATSWMLPFSSSSPPIMPVSATLIPASVERSGRRAGFRGGALAAWGACGAGLVKTQGSDTKLVAQMQPYYEARGLSHWDLAGRPVPFLVTQIADGENGGVMMNDFPAKYIEVVRECFGSETPLINVSEYLDHLFAMGARESDLPLLQPVLQSRIWDRFKPGDGAQKLADVIGQLQQEDSRFQVEGGSWTNNISWVKGYERLVGPMEELNSLFYEKVLKPGVPTGEYRYKALFHLLVSQTSCYRYWGQGIFVDYGREICRRGSEILISDF